MEKIKVTHLGEDYATVEIDGEEYQTSLGLGEAIFKLTENKLLKNRRLQKIQHFGEQHPLFNSPDMIEYRAKDVLKNDLMESLNFLDELADHGAEEGEEKHDLHEHYERLADFINKI